MKRIGVLIGGPSSEHDVSVAGGVRVMKAVGSRFQAVPVFITKSGEWLYGRGRQWMNPGDALARLDGVFNALHGEYGEDGSVQKILAHHQIPFTGSEALPSALAMNKEIAARIYGSVGIKTPKSIVMGRTNIDTRSVVEMSPPPWIIKPRGRGSSVGVSKVNTRIDLVPAIQAALQYDPFVMAQEYIPGRELTCAVLENFRGKKITALAPIEIVPPDGSDFFDSKVKYNGETKEICPADFHGAMLALIQSTAIMAHEALGLRQYSRTDMILKMPDKTRRAPELYVLETNSLPGLTGESLLPKAAKHAGLEYDSLILHILGGSGIA